jgi:hypothetical protein
VPTFALTFPTDFSRTRALANQQLCGNVATTLSTHSQSSHGEENTKKDQLLIHSQFDGQIQRWTTSLDKSELAEEGSEHPEHGPGQRP